MSVKLGDVLSPDTNLYVQLFGEKGETSKIMLRPVGSSLNKFEKGRTYKFTVETVNIGKVGCEESLVLGHVSCRGLCPDSCVICVIWIKGLYYTQKNAGKLLEF